MCYVLRCPLSVRRIEVKGRFNPRVFPLYEERVSDGENLLEFPDKGYPI